VQLWWDGVDGGDRDRWNNPATIRIQYEKAHPPAVTGTLPELEERTEPRAPFFSVSHGEVIGRQIGELDSVIDRVDDRLGGAATRITDLVREYDLSSPAKAAESARNFWLRYHEAEAGPQGIKWFIEALQAIVGDEEQFPPTPPSATGNGNGNPPPTTGPRGNGHRPPMRRGN
jgi:hypothetical protein